MFASDDLGELKRFMPDVLARLYGIVDLKRPFRCLSPDHDDRHPSMSYDPRAYRVKCFSCDASGDVFQVVARKRDSVLSSVHSRYDGQQCASGK